MMTGACAVAFAVERLSARSALDGVDIRKWPDTDELTDGIVIKVLSDGSDDVEVDQNIMGTTVILEVVAVKLAATETAANDEALTLYTSEIHEALHNVGTVIVNAVNAYGTVYKCSRKSGISFPQRQGTAQFLFHAGATFELIVRG